MLKRFLIILFLALSTAPAMAAGDTVRERILMDLREDGYREITISRTFLGRLRFVAEKSDARREIVVNPVNGVILRDYIRFLRSSDDSKSSNGQTGGTTGNDDDSYDDDSYDDDSYDDDSYDDDSYDDEPDDDEPDDDEPDDDVDNSGPGSANSGSGSGG